MKYAIWGCGQNSRMIVRKVQEKMQDAECIGYIDSNPQKWNGSCDGKPVFSIYSFIHNWEGGGKC